MLDVVYNASNNELVRTKTLVKGCIVQIDATPFRTWYENHYRTKIGAKKGAAGKKEAAAATETEEKKMSDHLARKVAARQKDRKLDAALDEQFASGRLLACVASRPGQSGRADGYILEGPELDFYTKMLARKKKGTKA